MNDVKLFRLLWWTACLVALLVATNGLAKGQIGFTGFALAASFLLIPRQIQKMTDFKGIIRIRFYCGLGLLTTAYLLFRWLPFLQS